MRSERLDTDLDSRDATRYQTNRPHAEALLKSCADSAQASALGALLSVASRSSSR